MVRRQSKCPLVVVSQCLTRVTISALFDEEESSGPRHDVWTASCVEGLIIIWDTQVRARVIASYFYY